MKRLLERLQRTPSREVNVKDSDGSNPDFTEKKDEETADQFYGRLRRSGMLDSDEIVAEVN